MRGQIFGFTSIIIALAALYVGFVNRPLDHPYVSFLPGVLAMVLGALAIRNRALVLGIVGILVAIPSVALYGFLFFFFEILDASR